MKEYHVYIITNKTYSVLYIGVTNNLERRMYEHKNKLVPGFSKKYNLCKLVYCDAFYDIASAVEAEKKIKGWKRSKKEELIESINPNWIDLSAN